MAAALPSVAAQFRALCKLWIIGGKPVEKAVDGLCLGWGLSAKRKLIRGRRPISRCH
jgi:hypothetical protein